MITSFADDVAKGIFHGNHSHAVREHFPILFEKGGRAKARPSQFHHDLDVLFNLPEHKNSRAGRDRHGKLSIPIDDRWCIQFRWSEHGVEEVEILVA